MRSKKITAEMLKFVYRDFEWCIAYNGMLFFVTYQDDYDPPDGLFVNDPSIKIITTHDLALVDPSGCSHWWDFEDDYFEEIAVELDCPEWNKRWHELLWEKVQKIKSANCGIDDLELLNRYLSPFTATGEQNDASHPGDIS